MSDDIYPRWLSVSEACKYTCMSDKTLMRYIRDGQIYGSKKGGKWYIDRLSIDAFMKADDAHIRETVEKLRGVGV